MELLDYEVRLLEICADRALRAESTMSKFFLTFGCGIILLALTGCAKPYYGYTKSEWDQLSPEEQLAAKSERETVLHEKNTMRHEDMIDDRKQQVIDLGISKAGY